MSEYESHPAAKLFPMLENGEMQELVADIRRNGLLHSIVLFDGKILDGRNRYVACGMAKVQPHFEKYSGVCSPTEYVLATNLKRRQLTASQKATIAVECLPLLESEARDRQREAGKLKQVLAEASKGQARDIAAAAVGVNKAYVSDAKKIKEQAPQVFEQVARGEKTISEAKREVIDRAAWELAKTPTPAAKAPEDDESNSLFFLKKYWRKASKKDRQAFLKWAKTT